jgi:ring-1,2-phenylacetyl-CoA epoxidase subunit PaaD
VSGVARAGTDRRDLAERVAAGVVDPELPMLTLADLGVLRGVQLAPDGTVVVELTPTYLGCPALGVMRADVMHDLHAAGFAAVDVRTVLSPGWSSDWITAEGRRKLAEAGIAPPAPAPARGDRTPTVQLSPTRTAVACPRCASLRTEQVSSFGATACRALWRCMSCAEPFEHVKEH